MKQAFWTCPKASAGKHHEPLVSLLVLHTRNNTDGNKLIISFNIALYCGDTYTIPWLGHTKLILFFTDCLGQKHDLVGRQKNMTKLHKFH